MPSGSTTGQRSARQSLHIISGHNDGREDSRRDRRRQDDLIYREEETFLNRLGEVFQLGLEKADLISFGKSLLKELNHASLGASKFDFIQS